MDYAVVMVAPDIYHHGIKGQKWGVRRYQNKDGSLTSAGKKRYGVNTYEKDGKTYKQGSAKYYNPDGTINKKGLRYFKSDEKGALTDAAADLLLNPIAKADARAARELAEFQMIQQQMYSMQMMQMHAMGMM